MKYADAVRNGLAAREMHIRQLSNAVGHSYEHCRKIVRGEPVVSKRLNAAICHVLKLNEAEMWRLAQREKANARFGVEIDANTALDASGKALLALWQRLDRPDRATLVRLAEALHALRIRKRPVRTIRQS